MHPSVSPNPDLLSIYHPPKRPLYNELFFIKQTPPGKRRAVPQRGLQKRGVRVVFGLENFCNERIRVLKQPPALFG